MFVPPPLKHGHQGKKDEGKSNEGKQNVAGQNGEVNSGEPTSEAGGFFADLHVIGDVADEKEGGGNDSRNHADDVALPKVPANEVPAA